MVKSWSLSVGVFGILLLSVPLIAAEASVAQTIADVPIDDGLLCYMVKADGAVLDLNSICGRNVNPQNQATTRIYQRPPGNLGGLEIFGRGNTSPPCFGLDAQGRRCPSSQ